MKKELNAEPNGQMILWNQSLELMEEEARNLIHSDDGGRFALNLQKNTASDEDVFISMVDTIPDENFSYIRTMRLRGFFGGGHNPFIAESFGAICDFIDNKQLVPLNPITRGREKLKSRLSVKKFNSGELKIRVLRIPDDDGNPIFMDLFVLRSGDVELQITDCGRDPLELSGETGTVLFKTQDHGGKNPLITESLTKLTERIANAKRA